MYEIAGVKIEISSDEPTFFKSLSHFGTNSEGKPDLKIKIAKCMNIAAPTAPLQLDGDAKWYYYDIKSVADTLKDTDLISICSLTDYNREIRYRIDVDRSWENAVIKFSEGTTEGMVSDFPGGLLFRNRILFQDGIVIHASSIMHEGRGIMFSAPSETGKSTQSMLWNRYMGAEIINDDCPAIRLTDYGLYVYGTPWSGSSGLFSNCSAPVCAVVMLEQARENSIELLKPSKAVSMLMPRCFLPYFDEGLMSRTICNLEKIIAAVPVYLLKCRPDEQAVRLLSKVI